jgi:pyruvate/2-oxoglutarate dehydrogenase complex dihydrolipoamide acyltransferase (E2) component
MRRWAPWGSEPIVSVHRNFRRLLAPSMRSIGGARLGMLALCGAAMVGGSGLALAQSDQQIRCMQLQQDLVAAQGGGGANRDDVSRIDQQIAQADRVFQGTQAAMEDANCFQSFFIFGRGLNRTPQCLKMNDRVEDARRQLSQLQEQRQAMAGGGGNRRRQAELQDAMARSGCGGQVRAPQKRGGGLLDFFGGGREDEQQQQQEDLPQTPVYRSIDPNGRYRSVCVRLCDGFFYPISYSTYSSHLAQEADQCQSSCAAPAELYVYRNPGQEIEQAISLNGSAYMDLPVALRFRKEYVQGCSCKQVEYNPTEIEAANKRAEADAASQPVKGKGKGKVAAKPPAPAPAAAPAPADQAAPPAAPAGDQQAPQLNLDVTGSTAPPSPAPEAELKVVPPAPPAAAPPPPPAPAASASAQPPASQSTVAKKTAKPAPTPPPQ